MQTITAALSSSSPRIARLRTEVMKRGGSFVGQPQQLALPVAYYRAWRGGRSRVQVRASFLYEQVALAVVEINAGWRLAGEHLPHALGGMPAQLDIADVSIGEELRALGVAEAEWPALAQTVEMYHSRLPYAIGEG